MAKSSFEIQALLDSVRQKFIENLPNTVAKIEALIVRLGHSSSATECIHDLLILVHGLIGSSGTFGYKDLSEKARRLEQDLLVCAGSRQINKPHVDHIWSLYLAIHNEVRETFFSETMPKSEDLEFKPVPFFGDDFKIEPAKILIVSDDQYFSEWLKDNLLGDEHAVTESREIDDVVEHVKDSRYDFIFMSVILEHHSGFEITKAIRKIKDRPYVPIIFVTSLKSDRDTIRCHAAGGDAVLHKPLEIELVRAVLYSLRRLNKACRKQTD